MTRARDEIANLTGQRIGNYRLQRLLGSGRMGVVYLANDEALLRPTAIKILSWTLEQNLGQDPLRWFLDEARAIAQIAHPGVVQIYLVAQHRGFHYIVMEYVDGQSGDAVLTRDGPLAVERATDLLAQTAAALHAAHGANVVHRDVKPANLLITNDRRTVKLGDFGMALSALASTPNDGSLRVGTPYFTAPELWRGEPATPACDIYSLGATYYRFLTARHPYETLNLETLRQHHMESPPPDPRELRPKLPAICHEIISKCLAKDPADRFASAQEIAWLARRWLADDGHDRRRRPTMSSGLGSPNSLPPRESSQDLSQSTFLKPSQWAHAFGFAWSPFDELDPRRCPYDGPPFVEVTKSLREELTGRGPAAVLVVGKPCSGRSTTGRRLALELSDRHLVFYLRKKRGDEGGLLERAFSAVIGRRMPFMRGEACARALVSALCEGCNSWPGRPVLIFDDLPTVLSQENIEDLSTLLQASRGGCFSLLLIGGPGVRKTLRVALGEEAFSEVQLPALNGRQVLDYARSWLRATRADDAPPVLVSLDAGLLAEDLTTGDLRELNRLLSDALFLASQRHEQVLTSWHVWTAREHAELLRDRSKGRLARELERPDPWPTEEALPRINDARRRAGVTPISPNSIQQRD